MADGLLSASGMWAPGLRCRTGRCAALPYAAKTASTWKPGARIVSPDTVEVTHPARWPGRRFYLCLRSYNQRANLYGSGGVPPFPARRDTVPPVYTEPREWLDADRADAFESCFECALGGAGYKALWRPGGLCGTAEAVVAVEDGVRLDYRTRLGNRISGRRFAGNRAGRPVSRLGYGGLSGCDGGQSG